MSDCFFRAQSILFREISSSETYAAKLNAKLILLKDRTRELSVDVHDGLNEKLAPELSELYRDVASRMVLGSYHSKTEPKDLVLLYLDALRSLKRFSESTGMDCDSLRNKHFATTYAHGYVKTRKNLLSEGRSETDSFFSNIT